MKNYIVLDLEWNQSSHGKEGANQQIPFEIIEIGAVKLDEKFTCVSEFSQMIRPSVYTEMHYKTTEMTHMNWEELESQGVDFVSAAGSFFEWCGEEPIFCTWGALDLTELQRNMTYYQMPQTLGWPLFYYDVQKLLSIGDGDGKDRLSLDMAVEGLGIEETRPFHRALNDAYYTAKVMEAMDFEPVKDYISVDYFRVPSQKSEEIYLCFPTYSKYVSMVFDSREEAIAEKSVTDMICYKCNRMLRKKLRWFSSNQKFFFGLAVCPEHGFLKGKIRMKKTEDGKVYVVKTLKLVEEEGALSIYERKEDVKNKRHVKSVNKKNRRHS